MSAPAPSRGGSNDSTGQLQRKGASNTLAEGQVQRSHRMCAKLCWSFSRIPHSSVLLPGCVLTTFCRLMAFDYHCQAYGGAFTWSDCLGNACLENPQLIEEYKNMHSDIVTDGTIVLSVDECYFSERVVPLYGYSEVGTRCVHRIGKGGWKHRSLVLGISNDGTQFAQVFEGGVNREMFKSYIRDLPYPPGTVLILDNCNTHKKIDDAIAERGFRVLYLPPYSPQFQPVELAFSKVKGLFRTSFPWPDGVVDSVHAAVDQLTAENSKGYFKHAADQLAKVPCVCSRLLFSAETAG